MPFSSVLRDRAPCQSVVPRAVKVTDAQSTSQPSRLDVVDPGRLRLLTSGADGANKFEREPFALNLIRRRRDTGSPEPSVGKPRRSLDAIGETRAGHFGAQYAEHEPNEFRTVIGRFADRVDETAWASAWVTADALRERTAEDAMELTRSCGRFPTWERGIHDAEESPAVST